MLHALGHSFTAIPWFKSLLCLYLTGLLLFFAPMCLPDISTYLHIRNSPASSVGLRHCPRCLARLFLSWSSLDVTLYLDLQLGQDLPLSNSVMIRCWGHNQWNLCWSSHFFWSWFRNDPQIKLLRICSVHIWSQFRIVSNAMLSLENVRVFRTWSQRATGEYIYRILRNNALLPASNGISYSL